jgi:hypothetical protein
MRERKRRLKSGREHKERVRRWDCRITDHRSTADNQPTTRRWYPPPPYRALLSNNIVGIDDVSAALAHFLAIGSQDHSLVHQLLEWLRVLSNPQVIEDLVPEPGVQEMEDGVLWIEAKK